MKIKKIAMFVVSLVLSASCAVSSACAGLGKPDDTTDGSQTEQPDDGNTESGGEDTPENPDGDNTESGDTEGGDTDGDNTEGGDTEGGDTEGGDTEGGDTEGGDTEGGDEQVKEEVTITFKNGDYVLSSSTVEKDTCVQPYELNISGYYVSGWYTTADFSGEPYDFTQPFTADTTLYAKLVAVVKTVTYASSACESAAFEWTDSNASSAKVEYKLSSAGSYTTADSELVRQISSTSARVDIVGLKGNANYDFRITTSSKEVIDFEDVTISAYDRSGYAHFNATSGVGAYNDDGTLKSGAQVIYVTEATKNTVKATINGKPYTGIVSILQNAYNTSSPIAIRVIGRISAATWNKIDYNEDGKYSSSNKLTADYVIGANGKALPKTSTLTEEDIISGGYNTLNTSVATKLNGLTNKVKYSGGEFDSYYNMCDIELAENVTLEGIGEDAEFFQWGLTWKKCNSIEVRNITFDDYTEDACSFEGSKDSTTISGFDSQNIWIHHNTFNEGINYWDVCGEQDKHEGDGGTDIKRCAYTTISYNHYYNNHKTGLVGGDDNNLTACVTFHHNFYDQCSSRLPLGRQANMHMYNNYYYGSTGTNMSLRAGAYALIENCYFENAENPVTTKDGDGKRGVAKIYNCTFKGVSLDSKYDVTVVTSRTQNVSNDNIFNQTFDTDSSAFYYDSANKCSDVEVMTATADVPSLIPQLAGTLHHNDNITDGSSSGGSTGGNEEEGGSSGGEVAQSATYSVTVNGTSVVLGGDAQTGFFEGGIDSGSDETKYTVESDRINFRGAAAYVKLTFNASAGQTITVKVNAANGSSTAGNTLKLTGSNVTDTSAQTITLGAKDVFAEYTCTFTAAADGTVTVLFKRGGSSTVYVKGITVTVQ